MRFRSVLGGGGGTNYKQTQTDQFQLVKTQRTGNMQNSFLTPILYHYLPNNVWYMIEYAY